MNAYEKAQSLSLTGTDAEIVAVLQALTYEDISRENLASWMARNGLLDFDGNAWFGLLSIAIDEGIITGPLLNLMRQLKSIILGNGGTSLRTTVPEYAVQVYAGIRGIEAVVPEARGMTAQFYDVLDGGRPWRDLTVEQFSAEKAVALKLIADKAAKDALDFAADTLHGEFMDRYVAAKAKIQSGELTTVQAVQVAVRGA